MHHRFDELTWPEVNDAVQLGRILVLPVGSVEQHGPHLPPKTDWFGCYSIAEEAVTKLVEFSRGFKKGEGRNFRSREDHHASPPTFAPLAW